MKCTRVLYDWDSEKVSVSRQWNNGDWNLRLAMKVVYMEEYLPEDEVEEYGKYEVSILAVSPEAAKDQLQRALDSMGMDDEDLRNIPLLEYESLLQYGIYATLWHKAGNNIKKLITEANKELPIIQMMFGFYMDRYQNRIGNDGWDFISGNIGFKNIPEMA